MAFENSNQTPEPVPNNGEASKEKPEELTLGKLFDAKSAVDFYKGKAEDLSNDFDKQMLLLRGSSADITVDNLTAFAKDNDEKIRVAVASHKNTPIDVLRDLAFDRGWEVRAAVASNNNCTSVTTLRILAKDENWEVRVAVASNENTPVDALENLSFDPDLNVLEAVATNKNSTARMRERIDTIHNERLFIGH